MTPFLYNLNIKNLLRNNRAIAISAIYIFALAKMPCQMDLVS